MVDGAGSGPGYELELGPSGAVLRYLSVVTLEGIRDAAQALGRHPDFRPDMPTVWDFSGALSSSDLDSDDMRRLAREVAPIRAGGGRPRVAVVTKGKANFAGARMFGGLNERRLGVTLGVFREVEEARRWAFGEGAQPEAGGDAVYDR